MQGQTLPFIGFSLPGTLVASLALIATGIALWRRERKSYPWHLQRLMVLVVAAIQLVANTLAQQNDDRPEAVPPRDLLAFLVRASEVRDRYLVNP